MALQEEFEQVGGVKLFQDVQPGLLVIFGAVSARLHPVYEPLTLGGILDVHELYADLLAIDLMKLVFEIFYGYIPKIFCIDSV